LFGVCVVVKVFVGGAHGLGYGPVCLVLHILMKYDELTFDDHGDETGNGGSNGFNMLLIHYNTTVVPGSQVHARNSNA
jgi:hypothetical protein